MNANNEVSWVVVADAGGARIFSSRRGEPILAELAELSSPEGEGSDARREQISERKPRVHESSNDARHAIEPRTPLQDIHADRLAADIASRLAKGLRAGAYTRLVLIAPARFAGRLDAALDKAVLERVTTRLHKDLRHETSAEIHARLIDLR